MSSFLGFGNLGWFSIGSSSASTNQTKDEDEEIIDVSLNVSPPEEDEEESNSGDSDGSDTDTPPAFPALNSAQRATTSSSKNKNTSKQSGNGFPNILSDSLKMPPPPLPSKALRVPGAPAPSSSSSSSSFLTVRATATPSSTSSSLALPPSTKRPTRKREKVALAPGYGPLDWAALKSSGEDLRGTGEFVPIRVTPSMLKEHRTKDDAWTAINGKVYNITSYLPYHPGGEKELMRVAGRDGSKLFALTHSWVNADFMLDACLVGFLVSDTYGS